MRYSASDERNTCLCDLLWSFSLLEDAPPDCAVVLDVRDTHHALAELGRDLDRVGLSAERCVQPGERSSAKRE